MTMILTCLTKDYVVQASDRQLSDLYSGALIEDQSNKALIYKNNFVFAYTGKSQMYAEPTIKPTIDWVAQMLKEKGNLHAAIRHLRDQADILMKDFYRLRRNEEKMVAFIGAGFEKVEEKGKHALRPIRIMVSNIMEPNNGRLFQKDFRIDKNMIQAGHKFEIFVSDQPLPEGRPETLNKILIWCLRHKKARGPETIGRFLAREIIRAAETNKSIEKYHVYICS